MPASASEFDNEKRSTPTNASDSVNPSEDKALDLGEKTDGRESEEEEVAISVQESLQERDEEQGVGQQDGGGVKKMHSVSDVAAVPNGGLTAWLQVAGAFFIFFNTWGIVNTFGVYQTSYQIGLLHTSSPSNISWIGSIQSFMMMFVGALTGPVYDAGYFRELLIVGTFLNVFGHMMLSLCTQYWQVLLAQGFCIGIGSACLFVPGVAILSTYFTSHLALATGIAASGSSLGGVLYPIILYRLINQVGFGWSVRTIGFIVLVTLLVPNLVMKVRVLPASKRPLVDWTAFRSLPFMLFILGAFVGFIGIYAPFFYMQSYAIAKHITNENLAFYLLSILNSASTFGRILPNMLADHVGPMNMILPCALMSGVLILTLMAVHNVGGMITFTVLFGFFSGTFVSLPPSIIVHLSPNRGLIGTRMGMCFSATAIGVLIGAPIAGAILAASDYKDVWIYGGVMTIAGTCLMFGARVAHKGWDLMIRA